MQAIGRASPSAELLRYRHLLWTLCWRDLRVRYKQSLLGIGWAVLVPLATTLVFAFVFTRAVRVVDKMGIDMPYVLFAYIGLVPWTFFSVSLNGCVNSLVANRNLVTKVYFPREVFPLSAIGSAFVDFCVAAAVLGGLLVYYTVFTRWHFEPHLTLLWVPVVLAVQLVLTVGMGMLLAMANLFYRDVRQVFAVAINLWMFLTCVVYPLPAGNSGWAWLLAANPMTPIIEGYRSCIIHGQTPFTARFALAAGVSAVICALGWWAFRRVSHRFAECI
jgi:ABC-type polysaccharide/polyol phosphate export permease